MKTSVNYCVVCCLLILLIGDVFGQDTTLSILEASAVGPDCSLIGPTTSTGDGKIEELNYDNNVVIKWISYEQWQGITFDLANAPVDLKANFSTDTLYFRINVPAGFGDIPVALRNSSGWPNQVDITITENEVVWDSTWKEFKIALKSMTAGGVFDTTAINSLVLLAGEGYNANKVAYIDFIQVGANLSFPDVPSPLPPVLPMEAPVTFRKLTLDLFEDGEKGMDCDQIGSTISSSDNKVYVMPYGVTNLVKWVSYEQWQGVTFDLINAPVDLKEDFPTDTLFFRINVPAGFGDIPIALRNSSGWPNQVDFTITEAVGGWDGSWKTFEIPIDSMVAGGVFDSTAITNLVFLVGEGYTADKIAYIDYVKIGSDILVPLPEEDSPVLRKSFSLLVDGTKTALCDSIGPTVAGGAGNVNYVNIAGDALLEWISYEQWQGVSFNLANAPVDFADDFATDTFFFRINAPVGFGDIPIALRNSSGWPNQADVTVTEAEAGWDGTWKTFEIPLSSMATGGVFDPTAITNIVLLAGEGYNAGMTAYLDYVKIGNAALYPIPATFNLSQVTLSIYKDGEPGTDCSNVTSTVAWAAEYINDIDYLDGSVVEWISYEQWQGVTFNLTNAPVNLADKFETDTLFFRINVPTGFGDIPIALRNSSGWPNQVDITITEAEAGWDGTWHTFKIPLNTMVAGGVFDSTAITNLVFLAGEGFTADLVAFLSEVQIGSSVLNAIRETDELPRTFALYQNYPNPFNPTTSISYDLPKESNVKIIIYDVVGREIRTLINQRQAAGYQSIIWDGKDNNGSLVSTGVYLCHMVTNEFRKVQKMTFLK